jgi:hypothetical protein
MQLTANAEVLGRDQWGKIPDWKEDGKGAYYAECNLGRDEKCKAPIFEIDTKGIEYLTFSYQLSNDMPNDGLNIGSLMVYNTQAVGVSYHCRYPSLVDVESDEFQVQKVTISGETSSIGSLDDGFHLTIGADGIRIHLGLMVSVKTTWDIHMEDISFHYVSCSITEGENKSLYIIQDGCHSTTFSVTPPSRGEFHYKVFAFDRTVMAHQTMRCKIRLCSGAANCGKSTHCPKTPGFNYQ